MIQKPTAMGNQWLYMRFVQKVSSHIIWKIETFIEEDTWYKKHCTQDNDASASFKVGTLGPHTVLPIASSCPILFSWTSSWSEISSLSKVILVLGKAKSHKPPNLGCRGVESPGWFDVSQKTAWDMMHEQVRCCDEAANHQLPVALAFWITQILSTEECSSLVQNLMQTPCSTQSFWMQWPHSTHAHSAASTTPTD